MTPKPNPFSVYDFLGYFVPGIFSLYLIGFVGATFNDNVDWLVVFHNWTISLNGPGDYIAITIVSYIFGHAVSFASSLTIERYLLAAIGYPSAHFLGLKETEDSNKHLALPFVLAFPASFFDLLVHRLAGNRFYLRKLKPLASCLLRSRLEERFGRYDSELSSLNEWDFFTPLYHRVALSSEIHANKFQNYVALYGFTRSICFAFVVTFWVASAGSIGGTFDFDLFLIWLSMAIGGIIFFLAFVKFYARFSLEVLMCFMALDMRESGAFELKEKRAHGE